MMNAWNPKVGVVGCFQNGKSTLLNCLLDGFVAPTGIGLPTTHLATRYTYGEIETVTLERLDGTEEAIGMDAFLENYQRGHLRDFTQAAVTLHRPILKDVDLIDTPGFDANPRDDDKALAAVEESDFALMVLANKGASQVELNALRRITKAGAPCVILVNCCDQQRWDPASAANKTVAGEIRAQIEAVGLQPLDSWRCNLAWFWQASGHLEREIRFRKSQSNGEAQDFLEKAQGLQEDVERFWKKQPIQTSTLDRAKRSRFLEVRNGLRECFWKSLSKTGPATSRALDRIVESWTGQLRAAVESAAASVTK